MTYFLCLQCSLCEKEFKADRLWNLCPQCEKPLLAQYDWEKLKTRLSKSDLVSRIKSIWRYWEMLPVMNPAFQLSLGEGYTPLIHAWRLGDFLEYRDLYIKDEGGNPTGSFKARGLCVAVSKAWELGARELTIPSAGNAAGAMSAYAALANLPAYVYMPKDVPESFIAECRALNANVQLVEGLISDCASKSQEDAVRFGRFDFSTLKEPYRLEGKKTMGYEIAEQLDWELPDVIVYPTGGGTGLIGMWKAFNEMEELGWIGQKRPRMVCVQAEGCAPLVRAFLSGKKFAEKWENAATVADGLRVPAAVGDFMILDILNKSGGTAISVSDAEMMKGANMIGKYEGLFVSPETGATLAAFNQLRENGWIKKGETVFLFNTGSGYKYSHLWLD
jgi:threonine synthase